MSVYAKSCAEALRPDPSLTVSEWSDKYRVLSKGTAEPGRFRTSRTPYLKEIMDCLSPHSPIQRVVFMKSSQVGGTELGLNWLGCVIHMHPAPIMIVQPDLQLAERLSKGRIARMIEDTPELREIIAPARERDSGNTVLLKEFRGGTLVISGANSGASLRQMPVRYLFCDEVSAYGADADGEGDPVSLAEKRTQTFGVRAKIFLNSTPKLKGTCRIEFEYEKTDQRRYFVPCPTCGERQHLKWSQLRWEEGRPETVHYLCEKNGCVIEEYHKTRMLTGGEWMATAPSNSTITRGYHINALYSPLGWKSWAALVMEFLDAVEKQKQGDANLLKAFVNSSLAETWEDAFAAKVSAEGLRSRVETYDAGVVQRNALVLTAGVDIQDDRLEVSVYGWGRGEESWLVTHSVIYGDPSQPEVWKQLDEAVVLRQWPRADGGEPMKVLCTGIDTGGHHTQTAYQYVRQRRGNRVIALKGASQRGKTLLGKPSKQDVNFRGQILKYGVDLYLVGTETAKTTIYSRFKLEHHGPGYFHYHAALPDEFFQQLTSEKKITRTDKRGFAVSEWVKPPGKRNEALDCLVYALAALEHLYTKFHRPTFFDQWERKILTVKLTPAEPVIEAPEQLNQPSLSAPEASKSDAPDDSPLKNAQAARNIPKRRGGGFVSRW